MITTEMYELQSESLMKMAEKLKKNRENIPKEERTGLGRYASAYELLKKGVITEAIKYACMGIRQGLYIDEELIKISNKIVTENFSVILKLVFQCEWSELNTLLNQLNQNFLSQYVFPTWLNFNKQAQLATKMDL